MIYVPYKRIGDQLRQEGIYLTNQQFRQLMKRVKAARQRLSTKLPVNHLLTQATYEGTLDGDTLQLDVHLVLKLLEGPSWQVLPLPFAGLPLLSASLDGKTALLTHNGAKAGYLLLLKGKGEHKLTLRFEGRIRKRNGWHTARLSIPSTPQTRCRLKLMQAGRQLQLNGTTWKSIPKKPKQYQATLGPRQTLSLRWRPQSQQTRTQTKMMSAKIRLESRLDEGAMRTQAKVTFRVLQGRLGRLAIRLPASKEGQKLISVQAEGALKRWSLQRLKQGDNRLLLTLRRPLTSTLSVKLQFEAVLKKVGTPVRIPQLRVEGAQWQHGWIGLTAARTLELKVLSNKGVTQMDPEEYASQQKSPTPLQAFMYLQPNYQLQVEARRIKARLHAISRHRIHVDEKEVVLHTKVRFRVERAGVFRFRFQLPKTWTLREVKCDAMQNYYQEAGQLIIALTEKRGGPKFVHTIGPERLWSQIYSIMGWDLLRSLKTNQRNAIRRRFKRKSAVRKLQQLFGSRKTKRSRPINCHIQLRQSLSSLAKGFSFDLPRPLGLESERGLIGLAVPAHLDLQTSQRKGLMPIDDLSEAQAVAAGKYNLRQAFRYVVKQVTGRVTLKRKKTSIDAFVWLPVKLREDGYRVKGAIQYKVRFAGTKKISFLLPKSLQKRFQLSTEVREVRKKTIGKSIQYTCLLNRKVPKDGTFTLRFVLTGPFKQALRVGELEQLALHTIRVPKAVRHTLYWGLQKGEALTLQVSSMPGYERIDAADLPTWITSRKMSRLLKSSQNQPKTLKLLLRKHHYARVLSTVVRYLYVDSVVSREGKIQSMAMLKVQNRGRQFLKMKLPQGSKVSALRVGARERYRFELDSKGELLVDLANQTNGQPFAVVLKYNHALPNKQTLRSMWGQFQLTGPKVIDTPISQSRFTLYLPTGKNYAQFDTSDWHPHNKRGIWSELRSMLWGREVFGSNPSSSNVYWLRNHSGGLWRQLPRRGRAFVFYTQAGSFQLTTKYRGLYWQQFLDLFAALATFLLLMLLRVLFGGRVQALHLSLFGLFSVLLLGTIAPPSWVSATHAATLAWAGTSSLWFVHTLWQTRSTKDPWEEAAKEMDQDEDKDQDQDEQDKAQRGDAPQ